MTVGFVGLGSMGGALAARLALSLDLVVYDRDAAAIARAETVGARRAESAADVARSCDTVHLCLPTSGHVRSLLFTDDGMATHLAPDTMVVDHTTGDPNQTRAIATELAEQGVDFVDAPVSGGVKGAEAGTIAIMVGARAELHERVIAALIPISPNVFFAGEVGTGHAIKLVNNLLSCAQRLLTLEAMALATKSGVDAHQAQRILVASGGRNAYIEKILGPIVLDGDLAAGFTLGLAHKDVRLACQLGQDMQVPMLFGNLSRELYQGLVNELGPVAQVDNAALAVDRLAGTTIAKANRQK